MPKKSNSPQHKLVVLGDSLSQGFKNGGIYRTDINFPAFLSQCFVPEPAFHQPKFTAQGGIPLNLEVLIRGLSDRYGDTLEWSEYLSAATHLYSTLRRIKRHWEEKFKDLDNKEQASPYHNQSVWGFAMNDAWMVTEEKSREYINTHRETYSIFDMLPDHSMYTTAGLVLNPSLQKKFSGFTLLDNTRYLQEHGGIENLIISMGANNIIGAVTDLRITYSKANDLNKMPSKRGYTVYRPEHFRQEFRKLAEKVSTLGAERVFTQTIPYITIPPVIRGVNEDKSRPAKGYFDYYTRFWIWDSDFNPDKHAHLTKEEAIELDKTVDEYNKAICEISDEYGWSVVPLNKYVSGIARRRQTGNLHIPFPDDFCKAMAKNPATAHLVEDPQNPVLSTEYLRVNRETRKVFQGGIFSLDGIHPTTIGYGLIAHLYYEIMVKNGVQFQKPLDWDFIIENDTLVTNPPYLLIDLRRVLHFLSMDRHKKLSIFGNSVLHQMMDLLSTQQKENA